VGNELWNIFCDNEKYIRNQIGSSTWDGSTINVISYLFLKYKYSVEKNRTIITNVQPERKSVLDNILPVSNLLVMYLSVYLINNSAQLAKE